MATPRGKIGRLPAALRDQVNGMIRDNAEAADIIAFLDSKGVSGVEPTNVSAWKRWGYERWEKRMEKIDAMRNRVEFAQALATENGQAASDGASALAVDAISQALEDFDPDNLRILLAERPEKFADLVYALTAIRKGDQAAVLLRQKVDAARALADEAKKKADASGNTDLAQLAAEMDRVLGA